MLFWFIILVFILTKILQNDKKVYYLFFPYLAFVMSTVSFVLLRQVNDEMVDLSVYLFPLLGKNQLNSLLTFFAAVLIFAVVQLVRALHRKGILERRSPLTKKQITWVLVSSLIVFIGSLLVSTSFWAVHSFGNLTFDQMIYTISQPLGDSDPGQIINYILNPLLNTFAMTLSITSFFLVFSLYRPTFKRQEKSFFIPMVITGSLFLLIVSASISIREIGYADIKAYYFEETEIYEKYYVDPREVNLTFPEEK